MKDDQNFKWTMKDVAHQYKLENSDWTWKQCWNKASLIYKELNKLNNQMWKDSKKYFDNNTPFSFYAGDGNFLGSIPELDEV